MRIVVFVLQLLGSSLFAASESDTNSVVGDGEPFLSDAILDEALQMDDECNADCSLMLLQRTPPRMLLASSASRDVEPQELPGLTTAPAEISNTSKRAATFSEDPESAKGKSSTILGNSTRLESTQTLSEDPEDMKAAKGNASMIRGKAPHVESTLTLSEDMRAAEGNASIMQENSTTKAAEGEEPTRLARFERAEQAVAASEIPRRAEDRESIQTKLAASPKPVVTSPRERGTAARNGTHSESARAVPVKPAAFEDNTSINLRRATRPEPFAAVVEGPKVFVDIRARQVSNLTRPEVVAALPETRGAGEYDESLQGKKLALGEDTAERTSYASRAIVAEHGLRSNMSSRRTPSKPYSARTSSPNSSLSVHNSISLIAKSVSLTSPSGCIHTWSGYSTAVMTGLPCGFALMFCLLIPTIATRYKDSSRNAAEYVRKSVDAKEPLNARVGCGLTGGMLATTFFAGLLSNANFTTVMPQSQRVAMDSGGDLAFSGFLLGCYGIGMLVSCPIYSILGSRNYREAFAGFAMMMVLGNLLYLFGQVLQKAWLLAVARVFCGMEGGVLCACLTLIFRYSTKSHHTKELGICMMGGMCGLCFGPPLASLSNELIPSLSPGCPPTLLMIAMATVYLSAVLLWFPDQLTLIENLKARGWVDQDELATKRLNSARKLEPDALRLSWLGFWVSSMVSLTRGSQRVVWETMTLAVITEAYGLSAKTAGFLMPLPLIMLPLAMIATVPIKRKFGTLYTLHFLEFVQVLGLVLMVSFDGSSLTRFLLGSAFWYSGNFFTSIVYAPLPKAFNIPNHPVLNMEVWSCGILVWMALGFFLGPIIGRTALQACPHQNVIVAVIACIGVPVTIGCEYSLRTLLTAKPQIEEE